MIINAPLSAGELFMPLTCSELPRLLVSRCLLGHRVRYDGGDKYHSFITEVIAARLPLWPVCPEFEAGLGVPRAAIELMDFDGKPRLVTVDGARDVTPAMDVVMQSYAREMFAADGMILKSKSPSCAPHDAPLAADGGKASSAADKVAIGRARGPGYLLRSGAVPCGLPVISELQVADPVLLRQFLEAVRRYWCEHRLASQASQDKFADIMRAITTASSIDGNAG